MEGDCYAFIWGIMHFKQYLHINHFTLRIDHKPLEWLATMSNAYGKQGMWIDMLQDFDFKIIHKVKPKHGDADVFSHNPISPITKDVNFVNEIQDMKMLRTMGIQTWIGNKCLRHYEIITSRLEIPRIFMVESKEQDVEMEVVEEQANGGVPRAVETFQAHNKKRKRLHVAFEQMTCLTSVNFHLELIMVLQKMVEIRDDSGEFLEAKDDDNWDNECNLNIW